MILRSWRSEWRVVVGREGEEKGGVSVEMLDMQRHGVKGMIELRSRACLLRVNLSSKFQQEAGRIVVDC